MKRGFVLTLDAMIGFLVIFVSITVTFGFIHQVRNYAPHSLQLRELSSDVLAVMEKNCYLEESISNRTPIRSLLHETPDGVCMRLEVIKGNSTIPVYALEKIGCEKWSGDEQVSWRTFVKDGEYYCAKMTSWYR